MRTFPADFDRFAIARAVGYLDGLQGRELDEPNDDTRRAYELGHADGVAGRMSRAS